MTFYSLFQQNKVMTSPVDSDVIAGGASLSGMGPCPPPQDQPPGGVYTHIVLCIYNVYTKVIHHKYTKYIPSIYIVYTEDIQYMYLPMEITSVWRHFFLVFDVSNSNPRTC